LSWWAATPLPADKRSVLLERIAGRLNLLGLTRPTDRDVLIAVRAALRGLSQAPAA
jgi:hypothetical protein